jgi:ABC-type phosphate transport system substrate-binding protein
MRRFNPLLLALILACTAPCRTAPAGEPLAVIVAADSPLTNLPLETVKLIYNRKKQVDAAGRRWIPINLPVADPLRRAFALALFSTLPEDLETYWNIQYFHGISPPQVLGSEEAVLRFVAATPGAIGYVRARLADRRVKVLSVISQPSEGGKGGR